MIEKAVTIKCRATELWILLDHCDVYRRSGAGAINLVWHILEVFLSPFVFSEGEYSALSFEIEAKPK
jgi:hypothetical protein